MTIRTDLIRSAARATEALGQAACGQVRRFLDSRRRDGGFAGRSDQPDLYYTVFGLQAWQALGEENEPPPIDPDYLRPFSRGDDLDFVHLCCLIRCRACLFDGGPHGATLKRSLGVRDGLAPSLRQRLLTFRLADGGFSHSGAGRSSAYGCFLGLAALQDLDEMEHGGAGQAPVEGAAELLACLSRLRCDGGGYANPPADAPSAPATAGALVTLAQLGRPGDDESVRRLLALRSADGGFRANDLTPVADLLSTATALHALAASGVDLQPMRQQTLDFLSGLWSPKGGFRGHVFDGEIDCEYTFYGLLAAGTLVVTP
ncbi:MAG: Prenyltransferase and squalene oxidase repeat protein [Planctomycetes bacterium ADurb.Bin126]|nr:MAG: Prenyltransferase and squalene oxidase repeat protein [Planctomycetes bacterium ADurb.Bin126]HOD83988.1 prenyltransferase/squalene oxidase repeat-containing protein [Phycisphaerae bacterium]HQL71539.1 prenyltransferase/squalene oxidase repeat-containing protein [Phycisphaerae bacterium]